MSDHSHTHAATGRKLAGAVILTATILVVEVAAGLISNSLALLSDAGHVLTDLAALALAWYATRQAARPADASRTYGYHRTGILTALLNALTLILIVILIGYEALERLQKPEPVEPGLMFVAAAVGLLANLYVAFRLREESGHNLNVRAAMLHVVSDIAGSVGVIFGGLLILLTGWTFVDPLISLLITLLIGKGAWDLLRETVDILMEATPRHVNIDKLLGDLQGVPSVRAVHDLHVWSLAGGMPILTAHIEVDEDLPLSSCDTLRGTLNELLAHNYSITHTTLQIEQVECADNDLYCRLDARPAHQHDHPAPAGAIAHD